MYLTDEEKEVVRQTGYEIIARLQESMVVTSPVLVAAIMLQNQEGLFFGESMTSTVDTEYLYAQVLILIAGLFQQSASYIYR